MTASSIAVIDRGLRCLSESLGAEETENFISTLLREGFDYTEWRQQFLKNIKTYDDVEKLVEKNRDKARFTGNAIIL